VFVVEGDLHVVGGVDSLARAHRSLRRLYNICENYVTKRSSDVCHKAACQAFLLSADVH